MNQLDALTEYMRACIRANSPIDVERWTPDTLRTVYNTLTRTSVTFQEWLIRMNPEAANDTSETKQHAPVQPTEEEMHAANDNFMANLKGINEGLKAPAAE